MLTATGQLAGPPRLLTTPSRCYYHIAAKMPFARPLFNSLLVVSSSLSALRTSLALDVSLPQTAVTTGNVVYGNFLGISFELSFLDKYCQSKEPEALQAVK